MDGVFVTGTDTGVGKSTVCAGLIKLIYGSKKVAYWKPIQTGTLIGDDTKDVKTLTELPDECFLQPSYSFPEPLAPYLAAKEKGIEINIDAMVASFKEKKNHDFVIVEGAGGILVPLTEKNLQIDFIKKLGLPVIIVGKNKLGCINSSLLTINACRKEGVSVLAVVLTKTRKAFCHGNRDSIEHFGTIDVVAEIDEFPDRLSVVSQVSCDPKLRLLFNLQPLPE